MKDYLLRMIDANSQAERDRITLQHYTQEMVKYIKLGNKNVVKRYEKLIKELVN